MEIALDQAMASIIRYVQDKAGEGTKFYYEDVPESFYVPSVFFPVPSTTSKIATLSTCRITLSVDIWFMRRNNWDAYKAAMDMQNLILTDGRRIPIVAEDGTFAGKNLLLEEVGTRKIDEGIVQLSIRANLYTRKETAQTQMKKLCILWGKITADEEL